MKVVYRHAFEVQEPPPDGLSRLRGRLETSHRHGAVRARALWLGATCVVAATIVIVVSRFELIPHREGVPSLGRDGVAAFVSPGAQRTSHEPVSVSERARGATAVQHVVLHDDDGVFYLVLRVD